MRLLCEQDDAELILIKAPSVYPFWYDEYDEQLREYAGEHGLAFYNYVDLAEEIGIDYTTDTYDAGLHMNLEGARKLSVYFARILVENHEVEDYRDDPEVASVYEAKFEEYIAEANK